jgi:hypothetical protein
MVAGSCVRQLPDSDSVCSDASCPMESGSDVNTFPCSHRPCTEPQGTAVTATPCTRPEDQDPVRTTPLPMHTQMQPFTAMHEERCA